VTDAVPDLTIRAPRPGDAAGLSALMSLPGVRHGTLSLPYETEEQVARRLLSDLPGRHAVVGTIGETIVVYGLLLRASGRRAHVAEIMLAAHDDHIGRGIGRRVATVLVDLADNWLGLLRLELAANVDNPAAIALYEGIGFVHEGTERGAVLRDGVLVDCYRMARLRPPPATS
jgi:L-phenylalanine/L-methionine N-acetyltransferase